MMAVKKGVDNSSEFDDDSLEDVTINSDFASEGASLSRQSSGEFCNIYNIQLIKKQDGTTHLNQFDKGEEMCENTNNIIHIDEKTGRILNADEALYKANRTLGNKKLVEPMINDYIPKLLHYYYSGFYEFGNAHLDKIDYLQYLHPDLKLYDVGGQGKTLEEIHKLIKSIDYPDEEVKEEKKVIKFLEMAIASNAEMNDAYKVLAPYYAWNNAQKPRDKFKNIKTEAEYTQLKNNYNDTKENFIHIFNTEFTKLYEYATANFDFVIDGITVNKRSQLINNPKSVLNYINDTFSEVMKNSFKEYNNGKSTATKVTNFFNRIVNPSSKVASVVSGTASNNVSTAVDTKASEEVVENPKIKRYETDINEILKNNNNYSEDDQIKYLTALLNSITTDKQLSEAEKKKLNISVKTAIEDAAPEEPADSNNTFANLGGKKSRRRRGGMKKVKQNKTKRIHAILTRRRKQMKKAGTKRR
jgi:hypothetical protein